MDDRPDANIISSTANSSAPCTCVFLGIIAVVAAMERVLVFLGRHALVSTRAAEGGWLTGWGAAIIVGMFSRCGLAAFAVVACSGASVAFAQNTNDINAGIQFDFSGARSQGMAGAFVAIADDATTVYGNPAGLTTFSKKEISAEFRHWNWKTSLVNSGHAYGPPTGIGVDTVAGVQQRTFDAGRWGPSFASLVIPVRNWGFGVFARAQSRYRMNRETRGAFFSCSGGYRGELAQPPFCEPHAIADGVDRIFPERESISLDMTSIGGSTAYRFTAVPLAIGAGVQYIGFDMRASTAAYNARSAKKYLPPDYSATNVEIGTEQIGNDHAASLSAGVLWTPDERLAVGASFQQGPVFHFHTRTVTGPGHAEPGRIVAELPANRFNVPDHYAAGFSFRPNPNAANHWWLFSVQYDRVQYSDLLDELTDVGAPAGDPEGTAFLERVRLSDANRIRVGGEWTVALPAMLSRSTSMAFRGGVFYDPQHRMYYEPDNPATGWPNPLVALYFPKGPNEWHASAGAGFVIGALQFDGAADVSDAGHTLALSTLLRF